MSGLFLTDIIMIKYYKVKITAAFVDDYYISCSV